MRKSTVHTEAEASAISEDSSKVDVSSHHQNIPGLCIGNVCGHMYVMFLIAIVTVL